MKTIYPTIKLLFCILVMMPTMLHAMTIDRIVAFGDSLSDNGNIYALTKRASHVIPRLLPLPSSPPYYDGRFSNGMVWVEVLSQMMKVPLQDYAFGGSWAEPYRDSHTIIPFGLDAQVYLYLNENSDDHDKDKHLYIIWSGGNDYMAGRSDVEYATSNTILSIHKQIDILIQAGAKHFLIMMLPDLGSVPGVLEKGQQYHDNIKQLAILHNQKLLKLIKLEKRTYPDVDFVIFNIANRMKDIKTNPSKYRLKNIDEACYQGAYSFAEIKENHKNDIELTAQANITVLDNLDLEIVYANGFSNTSQVCDNPDEYMFWDKIHPTKKVHSLIAEAVMFSLTNYHSWVQHD